MKKSLWALICIIPMIIVGLIKLIKQRKVPLQKEEQDVMETILNNQKRLEAACDNQEKTIQETMKLIEELRMRLNQPEYGVDPTTIDVHLEEVGA